MNDNLLSTDLTKSVDYYSEDFIYTRLVKYLKENGYKVQKELPKEGEKNQKVIIASRFFKKEIIEIRGYPHYSNHQLAVPSKNLHAKSWFTEALFNSFVNFSSFDNVEVAMALPNVGRYQAIIEKLTDYFTVNDLYFKIYLVNEDGTVEESNLNQKYTNIA